MRRSFLPIMLTATIFWLLLAFFWRGAFSAAAWCAGCAWTAWIHEEKPLATSCSQHEGAE